MALLLQDGTPLLLQDGSSLLLQGESGASPATSASLTVTPSFSATPSATRARTASLAVTPSFSAAPAASHVRSASLTVAPSLSAAGTASAPTFNATASLTVQPSFSAAGKRTAFRSASLTVTPSLSAAPAASHARAASLTVTPSLSAGRLGAHPRSASLTVTPSLSASRVRAAVRSASLTVRPVLTASANRDQRGEPGYPDGILGATAELYLGSTWVDVTAAALPDGRQYGSVKGGQPDGSQQPIPASLPLILDNPGYVYSPRNSASPYFGQLRQGTPARLSFNSPYGRYLRLEAGSSDMASVADTSALHVTGSLELRIGVILSDWRGCVLAARRDGTTGSWHLVMNSDGTLTFLWWDSGGSTHSVTSPSAPSVSWRAFRVTLDASNGNVQFYASDGIDGTWTSMGAAASGTGGAATSVRAGNCPLVVGYASTLAGSQLFGQVYGFRMYSGIGGTVVADAAFSAQQPGATSWTDTAGRSWTLGGGAELTNRDYRVHGELSVTNPSAAASGGQAKLTATVSGRLRRLQQGSAPVADSAIKRAILSQTGSLYPVGYWPMEDGQVSKTFGAAVGANLLVASLGKVQAAADSSFECSAPLPTLNADSLSVTVDSYTGGTAWTVRFPWKLGATLPASGSVRLIEINVSGGACTKLQVVVNSDGTLNFKGFLSGGSAAWTEGAEEVFSQTGSPGWWSVEATPSGSNVQYALIALAPGASSGNTDAHTVTGHGSFGNVTSISVNPDLALDDTVFGHLQVQKAWVDMFSLGQPLNAWRNELAASRFARVCAEQGIPCRILGRPSNSQAMGPQPAGSAWAILKDCGQTEQGIVFEPRDVFGLGFRTRESIGAQQDAVTLSFASSTLQGDLQPADDDSGFLNDVTGSDAGGTQFRAVLNDGSANSTSEPPAGRGTYAGNVPFPLNVADPSELPAAVSFYLGRVSVDEPRYRNVVMDLGVPGAPAADIARLRPGDKVSIPSPSQAYQSADISQLAMGWTEAFGPGRKITWDCVPASPYG